MKGVVWRSEKKLKSRIDTPAFAEQTAEYAPVKTDSQGGCFIGRW